MENVLRGFRVRVFGDVDAAGNSAVCLVFSIPPAHRTLQELSRLCDTTLCGCWWYENALHVRCFLRGNAIKFCGHGLLACAHIWRERFGEKADVAQMFTVIGGRRRCEFICHGNQWWLGFQRVVCRPQNLPEFVRDHFQPAPVAMALAGSQHGYRIFEWPQGTDIALVQTDAAYLSMDGRATILTAAASGDPYDFTLRYLAPQYRSDEDPATGSANAVLADYWAHRGLVPPYCARQCSSEGGVIFTNVEKRRVAVRGQVSLEEEIVVDTSGFSSRTEVGEGTTDLGIEKLGFKR